MRCVCALPNINNTRGEIPFVFKINEFNNGSQKMILQRPCETLPATTPLLQPCQNDNMRACACWGNYVTTGVGCVALAVGFVFFAV